MVNADESCVSISQMDEAVIVKPEKLDFSADSIVLDICRVCRGEGTVEQPLYYPCHCAGSIKYVHQECLLEWLRHSKKKYCELCKHPYAFTPVYRERMPNRLPFTVITIGILKYVYLMIRTCMKTLVLLFLWLIMMPATTTAIVFVNYGRDLSLALELDLLFISILVLIGLGITMGMIISSFGLLLLRDYMMKHGLLRIGRRRVEQEQLHMEEIGIRGEDNVANDNSAGINARSNVINPDGVTIEDDQSELTAAAISTTSHTTIKSSWLHGVTPREYRAYLYRRELHKERIENIHQIGMNALPGVDKVDSNISTPTIEGKKRVASVNFSINDSNMNSISNVASVSEVVAKPQPHLSKVLMSDSTTNIGVHRRDQIYGITGQEESTTLAHAMGSERGTFYDNIRCKVCGSVICVKKEHVTAASRNALSKGRKPATQEISMTFDPFLPSTSSPIPTLTSNTRRNFINEEARRPRDEHANEFIHQNPHPINGGDNPPANERWNILGIDADGHGMSFSEFIGIYGSIFTTLQNSFMVIICNLIFLYGFILGPKFFGKLILRTSRSAIALFFFNLSCNSETSKMSQSITIVRGFQKVLEFIYSFKAEILLFMEYLNRNVLRYLPSIIVEYGILVCTNCRKFSVLFIYKRDSPVDFVIQVVIGQFFIVYLFHAYRTLVLTYRRPIKIDGVFKAKLQAFMLLFGLFKLNMVLIMELIIFPIYCGWIIDFFLFPLVDIDRLAFYNDYPYTSQLIHWSIGIIHLVHISLQVKWFRKLFRPGLLYFIRNSEDPDNLPLKEAVERSLWTHHIRVIQSAILYSTIIACLFGGFSLTCLVVVPNVIPFNFDYRNVLHEIPYDIFAQVFNKIMMSMIQIGSISVIIRAVLRIVCKKLKLSSYFYGGRYRNEDSFTSGRWVYVPDFDKLYKIEKIGKMFKKPVQPLDIAKLPVVDGDDDAKTSISTQVSFESRLIRRQNSGDRKEINNHKGFTVVYRPNFFRLRVLTFLLCLWVLAQSLGLLFIITPVIVGRHAYYYVLPMGRRVLDIHAFQLGFLLMALTTKIIQISVKTLYEKGIQNFFWQIMRLPIFILKAFIFLVITLLIWPLMAGLYCIAIFSPFVASLDETPIIPPFLCWFMGIAYANILWVAREAVISEERMRILGRLTTLDGWWNMDFTDVLFKLLFPYSMRLAMITFGPPFAILLIAPWIDLSYPQLLMLQRWSNLISLAVPAVVLCVWLGLQLRRRLLHRIRDEHYLLGERLHNLERPDTDTIAMNDT